MIECKVCILMKKDDSIFELDIKIRNKRKLVKFIKKTADNINSKKYICIGDNNKAYTIESSDIDFIEWVY